MKVGDGGADPEDELGDGHRDGPLPVGSKSDIDRRPDIRVAIIIAVLT